MTLRLAVRRVTYPPAPWSRYVLGEGHARDTRARAACYALLYVFMQSYLVVCWWWGVRLWAGWLARLTCLMVAVCEGV